MKTTLTKVSGFRAVALGTIAGGTILAGGLIFNTLACAAQEAVAQMQIPATSAAIWRSIDKETESLNALIQAGKFEEVHHRAFAIRDLVAVLPSRSGSLPPDKLAQVKTNVRFVATLAQRLDATGDARDKAGTESNFSKLQGVLSTIRADIQKPSKNK